MNWFRYDLGLCHERVNKNVIFEENHVANAFNNFFINIGPKLVDDIPTATRSFESYVQNTNEAIKEERITINELKKSFFPQNKRALDMTKLASVSSKIVLVNFVIHLSIYLTYHSKKVFSQTV